MVKWCQTCDGDKMCLVHIQFWGPVRADPIYGALSLGMPLSSSFMVHFWKVMVKGLDSATCYQILLNFDTNTMKIRAHQCSTFEGIVFWVFPTVKAKDSVQSQHESPAPQ